MWNRILKLDVFDAPSYVIVLLFFLIVIQFRALFLQFHRGFVPFIHQPTRVAFSWDMFATRTERSILEWDPPLKVSPAGPLHGLKELSQPLEWNLVYDSLQNYILVGQIGCSFDSSASKKTRIKIHSFGLDGKETDHEFLCYLPKV